MKREQFNLDDFIDGAVMTPEEAYAKVMEG